MTTLLWLFAAIGLAPLVVGWSWLAFRSKPLALRRVDEGGAWQRGFDAPGDASGSGEESLERADSYTRPSIPSLKRKGRGLFWRGVLVDALYCALAFNLTFFWQELWLVLPKAWAGLHPILYHNDHDWIGHGAIAERLQGCGAIATLVSGLGFLIVSGRARSPRRHRFAFWMAAQGLFQALTQAAIGSLLPGNDVGRALAALHVEGSARAVVLVAAVCGMATAGALLAPLAGSPRRTLAPHLGLAALASIALVVPFRMPRAPVEVVVIPALIDLTIVGWVLAGAAVLPSRDRRDAIPDWRMPAVSLLMLLAVFQLVLRPGIRF